MAVTSSNYYLGLDVGTTSTKACAFSSDGTLLDQVEVTYPLHHPVAGAAEQAPMDILHAAENTVAALVKKMGDPPAGIGLSCAMHSLILCDEYEAPITQVITWADTRGQAVMDQFSAAERREFHRATGTPVHPMSPLVKLKWLLKEQPRLREEAFYCYGLKSFLTKYWTNTAIQDEQLASATGWYDAAKNDWYQPALQRVTDGTFPFLLPAVRPANHQLTWNAHTAKALGVEGVPLYLGGSDGVLANLGSDILAPGTFALSLGTSGAVRTTHQQAKIDPDLGLFNYKLYGDHYVVGGATNNGGNVLAYWQNLLRHHFPDMKHFMAAALDTPQTESPAFQPWLYGERAPIWDAAATASLTGLRSFHQPEHLAAAVVHGVTNNLVSIIHKLEATTGTATEIQVTGGITKSPQWLSLLEHECNRPVIQTEVPQATAYGAALVAMGRLEEMLLEKG